MTILALAYSNSFENSFHFDDSHVIEGNLYIRSLSNVPQFFVDATTTSSHPANAVYRPVVMATLAFDYWLGGGLDPKQFHLSQITMLVALGVLLVPMYRAILGQVEESPWATYAALLAAALFCVHTANTETLNIICVRSELLSALGVAGSFLAYLYFPRSRPGLLYLIPMVLGALAKSPAVMFGPLFCLYLLLFEERLSGPDLLTARGRQGLRRVLLKGLPSVVVGAGVYLFIESMNGPAVTYAGGGRLEYLRTQTFAWLHYGRLFFLPLGLTADTDWTLIQHWYDTRVIAGLLFVALLAVVFWKASQSTHYRPVAFGVGWFAVALIPGSTIFPLAEVSNEHRMFLAYIGLSLSVVWGLTLSVQRWSHRNSGARTTIVTGACAAAFICVTAHAIGTYQRNKVWRTGETLWRDVTEKSPENGRGLMNYGLTQMAQGKFEEAKRLFERAQVFTPNYATLEINLGIVTSGLGNAAEAEGHFMRALQLAPEDPSPFFYYARWLVESGRTSEAVPLFQRSLALSPAHLEARHQLLDAYAKSGQRASLESLVEETLALVPNDPHAMGYLDARGEVVLPAQASAAAAVETAASLLNRSLRLYQAHDFEGSIEAARKALELQPDYAEAYNNIAASFAALGKWDDSIEASREALRLKPDFQLARNNLAWAESERKKADGRPAS